MKETLRGTKSFGCYLFYTVPSAEQIRSVFGQDKGEMETGEPRRFPVAAQPEIMRAAEKDEQYASFIYDACRDAFRHLFGNLYSCLFHYF